MKILYDYQAFIQHHGGISRYHTELIRNLQPLGHNCYVPFMLSENVYLDSLGLSHAKPLDCLRCKSREKVYKWINQKICLYRIREGNYDIFHPTFLNPYYIKCRHDKPVVVTMHDLNHEKFKMHDSKNVCIKRKKVLENADAIIAVSNQTKEELIEFYNVPERKINVVYHGCKQTLIKRNTPKFIEAPYFLYIGGRNNYKNFDKFIQAFSFIDKEIHLVCTGLPLSAKEMEMLSKRGILNRVHQMYVSDEELNALLCNAIAFVYPSLMEGFGLPILEAFRCSCLVLASDIPCFHEVANDAALYFYPKDIESIVDVLKTSIFLSSSKRNNYLYKGFERLKIFTWEKTAIGTEKVYQSAL